MKLIKNLFLISLFSGNLAFATHTGSGEKSISITHDDKQINVSYNSKDTFESLKRKAVERLVDSDDPHDVDNYSLVIPRINKTIDSEANVDKFMQNNNCPSWLELQEI